MPAIRNCLTFVSSKRACLLKHTKISCMAFASLSPISQQLGFIKLLGHFNGSILILNVVNVHPEYSIHLISHLLRSGFLRRVRALFLFFLVATNTLDDSFL